MNEKLTKILDYWINDLPANLITNYNQGYFDGRKTCCQDIKLLLDHPDFLEEIYQKVMDLKK